MREIPDRDPLPRHLAPVPRAVEDLGLRLVWVVVAINLVGTAFGFWFYAFETGQLLATPRVMWPWVPDSPAATLLAAAAFGSWALGNRREWLNALAFFGNVILGLWTPYVLLVFYDTYAAAYHPLMFQFLFWSHLAMVVQALVIHRISDFPPAAVAVAVAWYGADLIVDFFVPVVGEPHHTIIPVARSTEMWLGATALDAVATGAVAFTLLSTYLTLAIRSKKLELRLSDESTRARGGIGQDVAEPDQLRDEEGAD